MINQQIRSSPAATASADNATATATLAAGTGARMWHITSVAGGYDASVSGNTLILKSGTTEVARWLVYDTFALSFSSPILLSPGDAANLELEASGGAGTNGTATITGYLV